MKPRNLLPPAVTTVLDVATGAKEPAPSAAVKKVAISVEKAKAVEKELKSEAEKKLAARAITGGADWCEQDKRAVVELARQHGIRGACKRWNAKTGARKLTNATVIRFRNSANCETSKKKRGRPCLLEEDEEKEVLAVVEAMRITGAQVTSEFVSSIARGIVKGSDNAERIVDETTLGDQWARSFLQRKNYTLRTKTTSFVCCKERFADVFKSFSEEAQSIIAQHNIPHELVLNVDHTSVPFIPACRKTYELRGSKRVEIRHGGDKRTITAVLGATACGEKLPAQLIYGGKTTRSLPSSDGLDIDDWHLTCNPSHWATEKTTLAWIDKILLPWREKTVEQLECDTHQWGLLVIDRFRGQTTATVRERLEETHFKVLLVPGGFTGCLQPLDMAGNQPFKSSLRRSFSKWFQKKIKSIHKKQKAKKRRTTTDSRELNTLASKVNVGTKALRNTHLKWTVKAWKKVVGEGLAKAFVRAGIIPGEAEPEDTAEEEWDALFPEFENVDITEIEEGLQELEDQEAGLENLDVVEVAPNSDAAHRRLSGSEIEKLFHFFKTNTVFTLFALPYDKITFATVTQSSFTHLAANTGSHTSLGEHWVLVSTDKLARRCVVTCSLAEFRWNTLVSHLASVFADNDTWTIETRAQGFQSDSWSCGYHVLYAALHSADQICVEDCPAIPESFIEKCKLALQLTTP